MFTASALAKKTKNEILSEYDKLLAQIDEAKNLAHTSHQKENVDLINKIKKYDSEKTHDAKVNLKKEMEGSFETFSQKLEEEIDSLENKLANEIKKFEELQKAIEISSAILKNQNNLKVASDSLDILINEHEAKKKKNEEELNKIKTDLEKEISGQKTNWAREQEEYEYNKKIARKREDDESIEIKTKREKELENRENSLLVKEKEDQSLREQVNNLPKLLEKECAQKEKETRQELEAEHKNKLQQIQKEWESKEEIQKLKIENLENLMKKQEIEIINLKKECELSGKKAQELAVKVIENNSNRNKPIEIQ